VLSNAYAVAANFTRADLQGADLQRANLSSCNFTESNLEKTAGYYANLSEASLEKCNLRNAALWYTNLSGALMGSQLAYAEFVGATLESVDVWPLGECKHDDSSFFEAKLIGVSFQTASFCRAKFDQAHLEDVIFADFTNGYSDFSGASFRNATLRNVRFYDADLTDTNFLGAILTDTDLSDARFSNTTMPDGSIWSS
jgi:uncharacterized protein YjbI with pentapeptide repeats